MSSSLGEYTFLEVRTYTCLFVLFFCITASVNRYDQWLNLPPVSIHQWRQADGAAIAWHYAKDPRIGEVSLFNLFYSGDSHAAGELPVLYWLSGLITRYWDFPAYPLRWIGLLLMFAGFWAFGWIILRYTQRPVVAVLGTTLLSTSPILVYYGPSFLPDAPAFCMILMMGACLLQAGRKQSRGWLVAAGIFAAWAMMLKISMAIVPLAFIIIWAIDRRQQKWRAFPLWHSRWPIGVAVAVFCAVLGCRWWIAQYNAVHHAYYFFADIRPIWRYDWPAIREILTGICFLGLPAYASAGLYLAVMVSLRLWWKHRRSAAFFWGKSLLLVTVGCFAYIILWFRMLREHDYYAICLMVLPAMLLLAGIRLALQHHAEKTVLYALAFCCLLGWGHSRFILGKRLQEAHYPLSTRNLPPDAFLTAAHLYDAGIPADARILCPEDPSPNIALLALQRHGWSAYNFGDRITVDTLQKYSTQFGLSHLALRDTLVYGAVYREFFPFRVLETNGWFVYGRYE